MALGQFFSALVGGRIAFLFEGRIAGPVAESLLFFVLASVPGWIFLRRRAPGLSRPAALAASVVLGWGCWMLLAELAAIFHVLHRGTLLLSWAVVVGVCLLLPRRKPEEDRNEVPAWKAMPSRDKVLWALALLLVAFITFWTFYHALVFPVVYWDSLILYVDYAQQTYEQHGFPTIVCGQVGIGLGANYPHLFPLTAASIGTLWGHWADRHAQFLSPFAGLLALVLLYDLALRLTRKHLLAALALVVFCSVPYATFYFIFPTDYAIAILLTTLFLWGLRAYFDSGRLSGFEIAALATAFGMHLNYLTGILALTLAVAPCLRTWQAKDEWALKRIYTRPTLWVLLAAAVLGSTWFIRNLIVTGNPVYAFFPKIFGGKNINLEVLESCFQEWRRHGDGIGRFGNTLGGKIAGLPEFLLFQTNYHWKYGPALTGLALPGVFFLWRRSQKLFAAAFLVFATVGAYHFFLADLYLYHTLMILPCLALFSAVYLDGVRSRSVFYGFVVVTLGVGLAAGVCPALVGGKKMTFRPLTLERPAAVRDWFREQSLAISPGNASTGWFDLFEASFREFTLGDSYRMWKHLNALDGPAKVLTHENRHHYIRRDIELIGLDDCGLIDLYDRPFKEVVERLHRLGIEYYLRIEQESHHPILSRLGVHGSNLEKYFELVHVEGSQRLYRLRPQGPKATPSLSPPY